MTLGESLKYWREQRKLTFARLEALSGVPEKTIRALEARKSKKSDFAPQLAKALGISLSQLLTGAASSVPLGHVDPGVAQSLIQGGSTIAPVVTREDVVSGQADDLAEFRLKVTDDSAGDLCPRGSWILWSRKRKARFGSVVLVQDKFQQLHVRRMQQGRSPDSWVAMPLNGAYATLQSEEDGLSLIATFDGFQLPPDEE